MEIIDQYHKQSGASEVKFKKTLVANGYEVTQKTNSPLIKEAKSVNDLTDIM